MENADLAKFIRKDILKMATYNPAPYLLDLEEKYKCSENNIINEIMKIKLPFNVNLTAEIGGIAALNDFHSIQKKIKKIISERERIYNSLNKLPSLTVYPSEANFLFIKINGSLSKMKDYLEQNRIFYRYYKEENSLRLTIGKPEQNDKIISCLKNIKEYKSCYNIKE